MGEMRDRVVLIVGAGPGVGRATALAFGRAGASVALAARRRAPLERLAEEVGEATGSSTTPIVMDLADLQACRSAVDDTVDRFGRIDAVVNVATAAGDSRLITDADLENWAEAYAVNVLGVMEVSRSAATHMADGGGGSIVQIGTFGTASLPARLGSYTASKTAMVAASMTLAREMGPQGVRVNIVTPGYITGAPLDGLLERSARHRGTTVEAVDQDLRRTSFLRSHVDPEDIAEAVLFLSSERARHITGVDLPVTAGQRA